MTITPPKVAAAIGAVILLALGGGFLWLGAPGVPPAQTVVHHDLPADRFAAAAQPALPLPPVPVPVPVQTAAPLPAPAAPAPSAAPVLPSAH